MALSQPAVSIGLPVYNGEAFLEAALNSLLRQSFDAFELIISDNASTDRTAIICRDYAAADARIRYIRNGCNLGAAANYNQAFELARGRYFKWAAHDDLCAPGLLAACVPVLEQQPQVAICYPRTQLIDAHGAVLEEYADGLDLRQASPAARCIQLLSTPGWCNPIFGLIRTATLAQTPLIAGYPRSDRTLLAELSLRGEFVELPDYLFQRRVHAEISTEAFASEDELAGWFDTQQAGKATYPRWRRYADYAAMVQRTPLPPTERARLYLYLSRFALSPAKARALLSDIQRGLSVKRAETGSQP